MVLPVIAFISSIAVVAHGICKVKSTPTTTPCPTTVGPALVGTTTLVPQAAVGTTLKPSVSIHKYPGKYVYRATGPGLAEVVFLVNEAGFGMLSVDCKSEDRDPYQTGWFELNPSEDHDNIHYVESWPETVAHGAWLAGVERACPLLSVVQEDLATIGVTGQGNVEAYIADESRILERVWEPLSPGTYSSIHSDEKLVEKHYKVNTDGTVGVKLGCVDGGDTGFKKYKLVGAGIGKPYKLSAMKDGDTLDDLVDSLTGACPKLSARYFNTARYEDVCFAGKDVIFAGGDYVTERLFKE
ncbi:hypothetical protein FOZ60_013035 [Perkinsus olseni]|uniref:Uncharacterized protein n=1 Tax=Perkinsus olseni TaxID=32597 RepID=A0A7J6N9Z4_PEROL|nr:hypothetical protein FOZ60_013035 [Perkinsus olseni]